MPYEHYGKWRERWNDEGGRTRSKNFGDFKSAKYHEEKMKAEVAEIRAGLRAPAPPSRTFSVLVDYWRATYAVRKRSWKNDVSILRRHLLPRFENCELRAISVEAVDRMVAELAHLNEKTIANILTLLISLLNRARDLGWLDRSSAAHSQAARAHASTRFLLPAHTGGNSKVSRSCAHSGGACLCPVCVGDLDWRARR